MDVVERSIYFAVGGGIGFILGYIAALLRAIKAKVDHMEKEVHEVHELDVNLRDKREKREDGASRLPSAVHLMMVVVLVITVFAAFSAGKTNNRLDDTVECLTDFNTNQNVALTSRDAAIKASADAEIQLWGLYDALYTKAKQPNISPAALAKIQDELAVAIREYRTNLIKTQDIRDKYAYDDPKVLLNCKRRQSTHE